MSDYEFTVDWFSQNIPTWEKLFEAFKPKRVLEIGAYEGRATCWMAEKMAAIVDGAKSITCVDTWEGGQEHDAEEVKSRVRENFLHNTLKVREKTGIDINHRRGTSTWYFQNAHRFADHAPMYDLIYIDGSHAAKDVLSDAVHAYEFLNPKGLLIFDDYLWKVGKEGEPFNPLDAPGMAIDAFAQIFAREMGEIRGLPLYQRYFVKVG